MKYILEYSASQKAHHISSEDEWSENVFKTIESEKVKNYKSDWVILKEFDCYEDASKFLNERISK